MATSAELSELNESSVTYPTRVIQFGPVGRPCFLPAKIAVIGGDDLHLRIPFLRRLIRVGLQVIAVGTASPEPFHQQEVPYASYPATPGASFLADLRTLHKLTRLFRQIQPAIVHAFDTKPSIYAVWAAKRARVPIAIRTITGRGRVFVGNSWTKRPLAFLLARMHRSASKMADLTAFYNSADRDLGVRHWGVPQERALVVPGSGIDLTGFLAQIPAREKQESLRRMLSRSGGPVVMMIARLLREKGVMEYLQAAKLVRQQIPAANFFLVGGIEPGGKGTLSPEEIQAYHREVSWLGARDDVPALLSVTDVFALPTYYGEGIPRVLLEAGACGRAVVTTQVPGCTDVITHGENGLLVRPQDPAMLAEAILALLHDEGLRQQLGTQLAANVRAKYSLDRIAEVWLGIYEACLHQHDLRRRRPCSRS